MTVYPELPPIVHDARSVNWRMNQLLAKAPRSLSGFTQRANLTGGTFLWSAMFSDIPIRTTTGARQWSAMRALLDGGVQRVLVPHCGPRLVPWPVYNGQIITPSNLDLVPFDDETFFSDDTAFSSDVVVVQLAEDADEGETELTLNVLRAGPWMAGEVFSIDHTDAGHRMYVIRTIESADPGVIEGAATGEMVVTIRGPLWEATAADADLRFDRPKCVMVLNDPEDLTAEDDLRQRATASVSFIEAPYEQ